MHTYPNLQDPKKNILAAYFEVEYENVFHMKELYKEVHDWLGLKGYKTSGGNSKGMKEKLYMELITANGASNHHIWWRVERKISEYVKYWIMIDLQTLNMTSIEVMHKGKKKKTNKGDAIFRVEGYLMLDYKDQWKHNWLLRLVDRWFVERWYKSQREKHKKNCWYDMYELEDTIKQYLTIHTTRKMTEPWRNPGGLP